MTDDVRHLVTILDERAQRLHADLELLTSAYALSQARRALLAVMDLRARLSTSRPS